MYKRPPRKTFLSYLIPFLIIGLIVFGLIYLIKNKPAFSFGANTPATLQVLQPETQVLLKNSSEWRNVPENIRIKLFSGDTVKTLLKGEAKINLFKDSFVYLSNNTYLSIESHKESDSNQKTHLTFVHGKILGSISRILNPKSEFMIQYENIRFYSRGAVFIINENLLQVLDGKVKIERLEENNIVASTDVGVGQKISFNTNDVGSFAEVSAILPEVYLDPWVEEALSPIKKESIKSTSQIEINETIKDDEKSEVKEVSENEKDLIISSPKSGDKISTSQLIIEGEVSGDSVAIFVNKYKLTQFKKGDTKWSYKAKPEFGNITKGENTYTIKATFSDDSEISKTITITYNPETEVKDTNTNVDTDTKLNNSSNKEEASSETETISNNTEKLFTIQSPKNGETIFKTPLQIKGTVSNNATKISVNDYVLSKFSKGNTEWVYNASIEWKNLKVGENTYNIEITYDDGTKKSETLKFNFENKSDTEKKINTDDNNTETTTNNDSTNESTANNNSATESTTNNNSTTETTTKTETEINVPNESNTLTLSVTSPEEDANVDTDPVIIQGTVPQNTVKVIIGSYTLQTFQPGDTQFKYTASQKYNNLTPGKKNKYLITAYDKDNKEISSIVFSFFSTVELKEQQ